MAHRKKKELLISAPPEKSFWVHNGPVVKSLKELKDALEKDINDEQFKYHATKEKSDFASWISLVLNDKKCANSLKRVRTRKTAIRVIDGCLSRYEM